VSAGLSIVTVVPPGVVTLISFFAGGFSAHPTLPTTDTLATRTAERLRIMFIILQISRSIIFGRLLLERKNQGTLYSTAASALFMPRQSANSLSLGVS
jgi:hypothetical protein